MRVALIGIGNMGKPMGRNMIKAGHSVTASTCFRRRSAIWWSMAAKAQRPRWRRQKGAEVVMTMLPTSEHVRDMYVGKAGCLTTLGRHAVRGQQHDLNFGYARSRRGGQAGAVAK